MDVSRSTLLVAALIAGFLVGLLATPSDAEATHQNLYQVSMAPPTHPTGSEAVNSCGWHVGSCYDRVDGSSMDWGWHNGSTGDYYVSGSGIGAWNSPTVRYMVNDQQNCSWEAAHTHEGGADVALTYYAENRAYACCYGNGNKQNNVEWNKTHTVQFQQGH